MALIPKIAKAVVGDLMKTAEKVPNLQQVSKITINFCPWDENSASTKELWRHVSGEDVRDSNRKCIIQSNVKHDGTEPVVNVEFNDGEKLVLKGAKLEWRELMYHFNSFCVNKEETMKDQSQKLF